MRRVLLWLMLTGPLLAQDYEGLLKQAQRCDPATDFVALRQAYTRLPGYNGYDSGDLAPLLKALAASDWPTAEKQARDVLISNYLQLDAHYVLLLISKRKGDRPAENLHEFMLRGLSAAIRTNHDGSSPEQSWNALNVAEEYSVCRLAGWKWQSQGIVRQGTRQYDRVTVVNAEGKSFPVYFDITGWYGKL